MLVVPELRRGDQGRGPAADDPDHPIGRHHDRMVCEARVVAIVFILVVVIPLLNFGHLRNLPRDFAHAGLIYSPKHLFPESVGCFKNLSGAGYICRDGALQRTFRDSLC
jgi:hypothetical protein